MLLINSKKNIFIWLEMDWNQIREIIQESSDCFAQKSPSLDNYHSNPVLRASLF